MRGGLPGEVAYTSPVKTNSVQYYDKVNIIKKYSK